MDAEDLGLDLQDLSAIDGETLVSIYESIRPLYRTPGRPRKALSAYSRILPFLLSKYNEGSFVTARHLILALYEKSYCEFLLGDQESSVATLQQHNQLCLRSKDLVGFEIGQFRIVHAQWFSGILEPEEIYERTLSCVKELSLLRLQETNRARCDHWIANISGRLFDLAVEFDDVEGAEYWEEKFTSNPSTVLTSRVQGNWDLSTAWVTQTRAARRCYVQGAYEQALNHFAALVDFDLSEWGEPVDVSRYELDTQQETARDYLYAGKCLQALARPREAKAVYSMGLKTNPDLGNRYYFSQIEAALRTIS